eukprot:scaffold5277_cov404-Prasinococcus_capsulatus_cf.AAC.2
MAPRERISRPFCRRAFAGLTARMWSAVGGLAHAGHPLVTRGGPLRTQAWGACFTCMQASALRAIGVGRLDAWENGHHGMERSKRKAGLGVPLAVRPAAEITLRSPR